MDVLTADLHLGHRRIIQYMHRPFLNSEDLDALNANGGHWHDGEWKGERSSKHRISDESVEIMDNAILLACRKMSAPDRRLFILGDFSLSGPERLGQYRERLGSWKSVYLIRGNHDHRRAWTVFDDLQELEPFCGTFPRIIHVDLDGRFRAVLSHYRHLVWDKSHRGSVHAYGHSHGSLEEWCEKHCPGARAMDVGIDNIYNLTGEHRPITAKEFENYVMAGQGFSPDHRRVAADTPTEEELGND